MQRDAMRPRARGLRATLLLVAVPGAAVAQAPDRAVARTDSSATFALVGATVIDGTGSAPRPRTTILVRDGRIVGVASVDALPVPSGVRVIDGRGTWVLPGFIDAHVHLPVGLNRARILNQLLAFGITAMRVPVGPVVSLRDSVERGDAVAPTARTAGDMIDGDDAVFGNPVRVHDEAGVRREVRRQAGLRVDFVKLYTGLPPDLVAAAIDEAHAHGLNVIGHLGRTTWGGSRVARHRRADP